MLRVLNFWVSQSMGRYGDKIVEWIHPYVVLPANDVQSVC